MPFRKVYECICDYCGECNYHIYDKSSRTLKKLRDDGFVIAMDGLYCCKDCYDKAKKEKKDRRQIMAQRYCNRCGEIVEDADYKSDNEYTYYCPNCDEDLYTFETHEELNG